MWPDLIWFTCLWSPTERKRFRDSLVLFGEQVGIPAIRHALTPKAMLSCLEFLLSARSLRLC